MLDFNRIWLPYLYLYIVGGGIFCVGMFIILKSKSLNRDRLRHNKWFYILIFGLLYYMGIHGFFTFAAIGETTISLIIALFLIGMITQLAITVFTKPNKI